MGMSTGGVCSWLNCQYIFFFLIVFFSRAKCLSELSTEDMSSVFRRLDVVSVPVWNDQVKIWTVAETRQIVKKANQNSIILFWRRQVATVLNILCISTKWFAWQSSRRHLLIFLYHLQWLVSSSSLYSIKPYNWLINAEGRVVSQWRFCSIPI